MSKRDEFPKAVKDALAKRAAFLCSNPKCRVMTVGPAAASDNTFVYIGEAAHICAASLGGPRFDPNQSAEERCSIENAIFLCTVCAEIVDRNNGSDYPVESLRSWKDQHEEWVRANLNKRPAPELTVIDGSHYASGHGQITALDIRGPVLIQPGTRSRATGVGTVTATRIGGSPVEE